MQCLIIMLAIHAFYLVFVKFISCEWILDKSYISTADSEKALNKLFRHLVKIISLVLGKFKFV